MNFENDVFIFSDEFPPVGGGAGVIALKMVEDFEKLGFTVTLLTGDETEYSRGKRHIKVHRITLLWVFSYLWALMFKIDVRKYSIIVLNDYVSAYIAGLFFSKSVLKKCCLLVHGSDSNFFFNSSSIKHRIFHYSKVYLRTISNCKAIIGVSNYTLQEYLSYIPKNLEEMMLDKATWHYAGIDKSGLTNTSNYRLGFDLSGRKLLLSVGRLVREKGYLDMLDILNKVKEANFLWLVVGDGSLKEEMECKVVNLGLQDNVKFLGKVPRNLLGYIYTQADVFWLLSGNEPFGLVYLEAAAFNLPSIAVRSGGAMEAVKEGVNGYYLDQNGDLISLFNKCLKLKQEKKPLEFAETFQTINFVKHIINQRHA